MSDFDHQDAMEAVCLALADGDDPSKPLADSGRDEPVVRQLIALGALRDLFRSRAAGAEAGDPVCPFRWGRLEVRGAIGSGSFGRVYRALDPVLDREVALKLFRAGADASNTDELIAEARRHAQVHHPRVLVVHGAAIEDGVAGMWTDLLVGETLSDRITESGPLDAPALHRLAEDLSAGLEAVHEAGLVHGDLKPANVWLDREGRAILMDFGAARHADSDGEARYGSPVTLAPEWFLGTGTSTASDVYALGSVLHHAATGRFPIQGDSLEALREAHRRGSEFDPADLHRRAPALAGLVEELLQPDPNRRPGLATVRDRLRRIAEAPQRRFRRRAIGALIVSLGLGLVTALVLLDRSERAREAAEQAREAAEQARREAQVSKDFLISSVQRMSPESERGLGTVKGVLEFLDEFSDEKLADTPVALGELEAVVGTRLSHFDEPDKGIELALTGIARIEAADPEAHRALAGAYHLLANAERRLERPVEARRYCEVALEHMARLEPTEAVRFEVIQMRGLLVGLLSDVGAWTEALSAQQQQLEERAALVGEDDPRMAVEYNNLGDPLSRVGRHEDALAAYRRALELLEAGETRRPYPEALVTEAIAYQLMLLGRHDQASEAVTDARERYRAMGFEADHAAFRSLDALDAGILRRTGHPAEAAARYAALFEGAEMSPGQEVNSRIGQALALLADDRPGEALEAFQRARALRPADGHPLDHYLDAAVAYAAHAAGAPSGRAATMVGETLDYFIESGYRDNPLARDLFDWADRLGLAPPTES